MVLEYNGREWKLRHYTYDLGWWTTPEGDAQMITEASPWWEAEELLVLRLEEVQQQPGGGTVYRTDFPQDIIRLPYKWGQIRLEGGAR